MSFTIITDSTPFLTPLESAALQQLKRQGGSSSFKVTKSYYKFAGKTFDDAYKNMKIEAAKVIKIKTVSGGQPIGNTHWEITHSGYKKVRFGGSKSRPLAYPIGLTVQGKIEVTLPQWTELETASVEDKEKWKKLFDDLNKHEQVHVCIALVAFNEVKQKYLGISGTGQTTGAANIDLNDKVPKILDDITAETKVKQKKYDVDTDNGLKEKEQAEYSKQITTECDKQYPKQ